MKTKKEILEFIKKGLRLKTPSPKVEKDKSKYTRKIKNYFEKNGEEVLIWSYLITALNPETKQEIEDFPSMKKTYTTKGQMYYLYNENLNAITHILTLETMIEDAMSRNQLFLDILRGKYKEEA